MIIVEGGFVPKANIIDSTRVGQLLLQLLFGFGEQKSAAHT